MVAPTKEGIVGYLSSGQIKGIGPKTAAAVIAAGADTLVAGSAVYGAEDPAAAIAALRGV